MADRLSKSRFMEGRQCALRLWLRDHEPEAPELDPDPELREAFGRGREVGEAARRWLGEGVLIDRPYQDFAGRIEDTRRAIQGGAQRIFEAAFSADGVFVALDALERDGDSWTLTEVKSGTRIKPAYLADVALQLHVVRRAGLPIRRAQLAHLNRGCRYPDLSALFVRGDVEGMIGQRLEATPQEIAAQQRLLAGERPTVEVGLHCHDPWECPFISRCWAPLPEHHCGTLYQVGKRRMLEWRSKGWQTVADLPDELTLGKIQARQRRAVREGRLIVEEGLAKRLRPLRAASNVAILDFETVMPAIPCWNDCAPYDAIPALFCLRRLEGETTAWISRGPEDPREPLARALLEATRRMDRVVAWSPFEERRIRELAADVPHLAEPLLELAGKLFDLLPVVRDHVYHPAFHGSFSLKSVAPALAPEAHWEDLELAGGRLASLQLARVKLEPMPEPAREALIGSLTEYCHRDTLATAAVLRTLFGMAGM